MSFTSKAKGRVVAHVNAKYEKIDVASKQGLFNHKCFFNAVQWAVKHPKHTVVEVMYIDNGDPILHYVVEHEQKYYEVTLGFLSQSLTYFKLRTIHSSDYRYIGYEFDNAKNEWLYQFTNWFTRLFIDRIV